MNKKLVPFILAAGVAALGHNVLYFSRELTPPAVRTAAEEEEPSDAELADERTANASLPALSPDEIAQFLESLSGDPRNPFLIASETAAPFAGAVLGMPRVSGTLWSNGRRVAWIDGRPVSEGESVGSFELLRIDRERVLFRRAGIEVEISIAPDTPSPEEPFDEI